MSYLTELLGTAYKEGMTEDEISEALSTAGVTAAKPEDNSAELTRLKGLVSKANGEAASYKRQLQERMSAEEVQKAEAQEQLDKLIADNKEMKRQLLVGENQSKLMSAGYTAELAKATAEAMADGDMNAVMANQIAFLESEKQRLRAEAVRSMPLPPSGSATDAVTKAEFDRLSMAEKMSLYDSDPELYAKLRG